MELLSTPSSLLMIIAFIIGYLLIAVEHFVQVNKATTALMTAVVCWTIQFLDPRASFATNIELLNGQLADISQIVFFLLGAMMIVEIISAHQGFNIITDQITLHSKRQMLLLLGILTFFLSSVLDNLTTTILMVSLLRRLMPESEERLIIGGALVIAANAGGAWTPIGDVTTTMLWIEGQITTWAIMKTIFLPSVCCLFLSLLLLLPYMKGNIDIAVKQANTAPKEPGASLIFYLGIGALISVPIFKFFTGLPPFMGILFGLSILWITTDILHYRHKKREHLRVPHIIGRIDTASGLFFLGILLSVAALEAQGILHHLAEALDRTIGNPNVIAGLMGLLSALIDNVPLVAAAMGMYSLEQYPTDSPFWLLMAYCVGTGGSILIIGSAAGVAYMGIEKANFFWYVKRISIPALVGYFGGMALQILIQHFV